MKPGVVQCFYGPPERNEPDDVCYQWGGHGATKRHANALAHLLGFEGRDASAVKARILEGLRERKTVGWAASCRCHEKISQGSTESRPTVPCIVLDPFGGSGTTGEVALELGRRAILIELNPDYLPLIEQRTNVTPGLAL